MQCSKKSVRTDGSAQPLNQECYRNGTYFKSGAEVQENIPVRTGLDAKSAALFVASPGCVLVGGGLFADRIARACAHKRG